MFYNLDHNYAENGWVCYRLMEGGAQKEQIREGLPAK
ncbi:hypothetical protein WRSd3_02658 [Shigella dysenteriae WRSd3]|uniref:Uncharacterized protein n=1 Tax=Shigella dysenteriae WRSd3 TaxID=1401327 RepID=A0A090NX18_SHIDY|nr:hypothetical protein WRSd3_02658 [Shigella dysenteriae WRSd3]ESU81510.1 hypothetical protein WRSd5_03012 [Shigella dysenteriae WRSd5]